MGRHVQPPINARGCDLPHVHSPPCLALHHKHCPTLRGLVPGVKLHEDGLHAAAHQDSALVVMAIHSHCIRLLQYTKIVALRMQNQAPLAYHWQVCTESAHAHMIAKGKLPLA